VNANLPMNEGEFFRRKPGDGVTYKFAGSDMAPRVAVQRVAFAPQTATSITFPVWNGKNFVSSVDLTPKESPFEVNVFPNPATDFVQLFVNKFAAYEVHISDISGRAIEKIDFEDNVMFDVTKYSSGLYFAKVVDKKNPSNVVVKKFNVR
jgi:hypothetical protein